VSANPSTLLVALRRDAIARCGAAGTDQDVTWHVAHGTFNRAAWESRSICIAHQACWLGCCFRRVAGLGLGSGSVVEETRIDHDVTVTA
jgi:hypothetical protein